MAEERPADTEDSSLNLDAVRASLGEAASVLAEMGEAVRRAPDARHESTTRTSVSR